MHSLHKTISSGMCLINVLDIFDLVYVDICHILQNKLFETFT